MGAKLKKDLMSKLLNIKLNVELALNANTYVGKLNMNATAIGTLHLKKWRNILFKLRKIMNKKKRIRKKKKKKQMK
jgi:hypothetical protein